MRFYPLAQDTPADEETIMTDYEQSRRIGAVSLGESVLFFRARRKAYYIPYSGISRCFRRVILVPARMCCGRGDLSVENLVIMDGDGKELAQIQLPGERAAKELMKELALRLPEGAIGKPSSPRDRRS